MMDTFDRLSKYFAVTPAQCQRIGALIVLMGSFENLLELSLWAATGENPAGRQPSTDTLTVGVRVRKLRECSPNLPKELARIAELVCDLAENLLPYRHAIAHGWPTDEQMFIKDPAWHGELRKRSSSKAIVLIDTLDVAIQSAEALCMGTMHLAQSLSDPVLGSVLVDERALQQARDQSQVLRTLSE